MKQYFFFLLFIYSVCHQKAHAQKLPIFDNPKILNEIEQVAYYVYNEYPDSADLAIDKMSKRFPKHPVIPMMRAMNIAWQDQPIRTNSPSFPDHQRELDKVVELAVALREKNPGDLEGLFFEMTAHGLLAEYYAREGTYSKAISQAKKTYDFITLTMEQTDKSPEFYFLAGLYNYFRVRYPEKHPVYTPFLWFFKSGDKGLGLQQLDSAVHLSTIVKAEAHLYTAYIYLRYQNDPAKAEYYIKKISEEYPRNSYFKTKYVESLVARSAFQEALPMIEAFINHDKPYYKACGEVYMGCYYEYKKKYDKSEFYFTKTLRTLSRDKIRGEYFQSLAFLGLGKAAERKGDRDKAIGYFKKAIEIDENDAVTDEAKSRLYRLD